MKKLFLPAAMFLSGMVLGVGLMFIVIQKGPNQVIANQAYAVNTENVVYATLLHDQKYAELNRLIEVDMNASLNFMKALGFTDKYESSARLVRGYYDLPGTEMPSHLASTLSNVKGSDVRRLASAMANSQTIQAVRNEQ